jgi:hypothetical protein
MEEHYNRKLMAVVLLSLPILLFNGVIAKATAITPAG